MATSNQLVAYLVSQPPNVLDQLYQSPASAVAVWRALPELAKQWVARLAFVEEPISSQVLAQWVKQEFTTEAATASEILVDLHILLLYSLDDGPNKSVLLAPNFKKSIQQGMLGGAHSLGGLERTEVTDAKYRKSLKDLSYYAVEQRWECLLQFLALPSDTTQKAVGAQMQQVLYFAELVQSEDSHCELEITSAGFQFLLMDLCSQLWTYLLSYLKWQSSLGNNQAELIDFLFRLTFCSPAVPYKSEPWSELVQDFVLHLRELGLIYMRKRKDGWLYVTPLIRHLTSTYSQTQLSDKEGFLVVETNFRVYAYTDSQLQLSILSTFAEMLYRFGNMSVGLLTRESVRRALAVGITAEQIVSYLRSHAHSQMTNELPVIPPTISDQLRLWELERDRFKFEDAVMYDNFYSGENFEQIADFAESSGALLWRSSENSASTSKVVIVSAEGHEKVKSFWKDRKNT